MRVLRPRRGLRALLAGLLLLLLPLPGFQAVAEAQTMARHRVVAGESLWRIGLRYGVPWWEIQRANGLRGTLIYPGQVLVIPSSVPGGRVVVRPADVDLLARLVRAEAEAEPFAGQVAVAAVVLNRVRSPHFPDTIPAVIYQRGQFETVTNGRIHLPPTPQALRAVRAALAGWDPSGGALFFYNPRKAYSAFLAARRVTAWIGQHVFLR